MDNTVDGEVYFRKSVLALLKAIASQFGEKVDSDWLQSFGVPSDVVAKYKNRSHRQRMSSASFSRVRSGVELNCR